MGDWNSSLTRVQPVFNELLDRWPDGKPWLGALWEMAARSRPGVAVPMPSEIGTLLPSETPPDSPSRLGKVFERTVPPPAAFLRWLLAHPETMQVRDRVNFGAKSEASREWRRKLFSGDELLVARARDEAERQLAKRAAQRGRQKWWAFEGFSHVDCCLITETCVIFVEGKRTEAVSPSTLWFEKRSQIWRNVEVAREFARGKEFGVILAVESERDGLTALSVATESVADSYPHLESAERTELDRRLLGFVTWQAIATRFALPPSCLLERTS